MTPRIEQNVRDGVPYLARRAQDVEVEAIREHGTTASEDAVCDLREPGPERFHPGREVARARRFDDCM